MEDIYVFLKMATTRYDGTRVFLLLVMLMTADPVTSGFAWSPGTLGSGELADQISGSSPLFLPAPRHVDAAPGQTALLHCKVKDLGDRMVSWIRSCDLQILTAGDVTFTADPRFSVSHAQHDPSWGLVIKGIRPSDGGQYECQVNTDPKINYNVTLVVREHQMGDSPYPYTSGAHIDGPREQTVKRGSTVTLTCSAPAQSIPQTGTQQVTWLKDGRAVSFQAARGGISVNTEWDTLRVRSTLTVALVEGGDSGKYSCTPPRGGSDHVALVVVEGERSEAMLRGRAPLFCLNVALFILSVFNTNSLF